MKTVVIYQSRAGFTKKYAGWISERLSCDIFPLSKISAKKMATYDTIIFGGGIYGNIINGTKFLKKHIGKFSKSKIYVFAVGGTPIEMADLKTLKHLNFPEEECKRIKLFYFRGGFDFSKLNFTYRIAMLYQKRKLTKKQNLSLQEKQMLKAYDTAMDFTSRKETKQLTRLIKK